MKMLLVLPLIVPLLTAALALLAWRWRQAQRWIGLAGSAAHVAAALALLAGVRRGGIQTVQIGNWPAPFGITLVADLFSAVMVVIAAIVGLLIVVYSMATVGARRESFGYYALVHTLLMGVCGAFLTGDIFNLYVWFEVLLISSFVLMALGSERAQLEGAIKYVTLNLMSSALFLAAVGILYGMTGTLNLADLANRLKLVSQPELVTAVAMMFFVAFGIKSAIFPLFFWLPASYHTPPVAVTALFSALLTKVGVYAMVRVFTLLFVGEPGFTQPLILVVAGLTMVTGVLGAVAQNEMRRLLSFHIVSQIGYLLMGLGLQTRLALAATIFFMAHVIVAKSALFLAGGVAERWRGTSELRKLGGLYADAPGLAVLFFIPAMSLAGIPPLSGFWAKLMLARAGLEAGAYTIVAVSLATGILTLFSMTKIWAEAFWKPAPQEARPMPLDAEDNAPRSGRAAGILMMAPVAVLAAAAIAMGLAAEPLFALCAGAADQLLNPSQYIEAVMGGAR